jgi:FecR protein
MRRRALLLAALAALVPLAGAAQPKGPRTLAGAATLNILQARVDRVTAAGEKSKATDGMTVAAGDRIVTSGSGTALLTFLDGSTATVQPGSDVVVRRLGGGGQRTGILINAGTVWARVSGLASPAPAFSLESNTATAAVHDGVIGAVYSKGDFSCWTQRGELTVSDSGGRALITLQPGQQALVDGKQAPQTQPFFVNAMSLRVEASPGVWPLVEMPMLPLQAGFVAPGIEVNQVYGSVTRLGADGTRMVEVPAGYPGPYTVRIQGAADGPFTVVMTGLYRGSPAYRLEFAGTIARDEWLWTSAQQELQQTGGFGIPDYRSARAESVRAAKFAPMRGDLPGAIVLAPGELGAKR